MKNVVILSGAGMSAESGILTFRDMGGVWDQYNIEEVASPIAWKNSPQLVMNFYNTRRKQLLEVEPNKAHIALVELEKKYNVEIITQNVDDLHERAGSSNVLHLHGELRKVRSVNDDTLITELEGWKLEIGDLAEDGAQLRPHIVWFGEDVPLIDYAAERVSQADILIIIGTSLSVYPAAGLMNCTTSECTKYYIDPKANQQILDNIVCIDKKATIGVPKLIGQLLK
ncbi:MAG: NAD-dependent protein deacylase [Bacteroidetes bacterium 4572_112]|nr:MAG: NAD-dependent protein deacylase [Bacteroidetes bacterium 4572_112]